MDDILIKIRADISDLEKDLANVKAQYSATIKEIEGKGITPKVDTVEVEKASKSMVQSMGDVKGAASQIFRGDVLDGLRNLNQSLGEFKTGAVQAFTSLRTAGVGSLTAIRAAMIATGVGAFAVAVGLIAANWDKIKLAITGTNSVMDKMNEKSAEDLKNQKEKLKVLNNQDNTLKLQGKTEKEIRDSKIKELNTTIEIAKVNLRNQISTLKSQYEAEKRNKEILKGLIEFTVAPLAFLLRNIDLVGKALGKNFGLAEGFRDSLASFVFDPVGNAKENIAAIKELEGEIKNLENTRDGFILKNREKEKKSSKEIKEAKEKDFKDYSNTVKNITEDLISDPKEYEQISKIVEESLLSPYNLERQKILENYGEKIMLAEKYGLETKGIIDELLLKLDELDNKQSEVIKNNIDSVNKYLGDAYSRGYQTASENEAELQKQREENIKKIQEAAAVGQQAYALLSTALFNADTQKRQEESEKLKAEQEEELRLAGDNEQKKDVIRQKYALKERELKRKQAEADKRKAIFDAIVGTSVAVIQAGVITPAAIIAAALGAAQIALIAATPIPKFAKGVVSFDGKGGLVKGEGTGTSDSNLAYLSRGESVIPAEPTSANLGLINELVNGDVDS